MGIELDRLRELVEDIASAAGYELVDLELKGAGNKRVLTIFIDKEGGISHRDCELISERVGTVLDVEDLLPFSYTLEVSSPGLERKLLKKSDFMRFEGHLAKIQTRYTLGDQTVFRGRLAGLQQDNIQLELDKGDLLEIPLDIVREARLEVDWQRELRAERSR